MRLAHPRRRSSRRGAPVRAQAGETLLEVLVAIILMGIGFSAVFGGMYTSARIAQINQRNSKASIAAQAVAEGLLQPALPIPDPIPPGRTEADYLSTYRPCATAAGNPVDTYRDFGLGPPVGAIPPGWTWNVVEVRYLASIDPILTDPDVYTPDFSRSHAQCLSSGDLGLQELTIEVSNGELPEGPRVVEQLVIIKRDQRCPDTFENADRGPC